MFSRSPSFICPTLVSRSVHKSQTSSSSTPTPTRNQHVSNTRPQRPRRKHIQHIRSYATITSDDAEPSSPPPRPLPAWPKPPSGHKDPTPYQIFSMESSAPYTKAKYYRLVKLYHPDLSHPSTLPPGTKMERYRLIVAAHTLLSDPRKRDAYDRYGAGWNGRADTNAARPGPFSQSWSSSSDPIWQNATWEDWERFRAKREGEEAPTPIFMSNGMFVLLVSALAVLGSSWNYSRAHEAGTYLVEQRDLVHDRSAKDLRRVRQETAGLNGRDERIRWFVRQREATMGTLAGNDAEAIRDERAERLLRDREVCASEGITGQ